MYATQKNMNIVVTNIIRKQRNWYCFDMGITSDVVPGHGKLDTKSNTAITCMKNNLFHVGYPLLCLTELEDSEISL
jgi:hypothetical protein